MEIESTKVQIQQRLLKRIMSRILADAGTDRNAVYVLVYPHQNNTLILDGSWEISQQETEALLELMRENNANSPQQTPQNGSS